jgi:hypothetical protein
MKAQRRHELKQNTLARSLENLPEVSRRHGTKILLVLAVGLAVALLLRSRVTSSRTQAAQAAYSLNHGRELIEQLQEASERIPSTQFIPVAREISKGVEQAVQQVLDSTDDPALLAEARLVQGDLNWQLASMPDPPGATTRPELALPRTDEQLLQAAAEAYQAVLDDPSAPKQAVTTAHLSLAAVAENRRQWEAAREHYQRVVDDTATPKPLKDLAAAGLTRLQTIQRAPLIAPPATAPGTARATTSTAPATTSTAPATSAPADAKPQAAPDPG